jgi:hypothetical protein
MSKKPLACRHCKKPFRRAAGAGLECGSDCEQAYINAMDAHRKALSAAGFVQHPETPNVWHKDGVAITEEQVKHVGFEKAIRKHTSAVAEHSQTH